MRNPELKYIGKKIDLKTLRNFVIDASLSESDTLLLNYKNFDDIVLEYREIYGSSINIPYSIFGIPIKEDTANWIPLDRIGILKSI